MMRPDGKKIEQYVISIEKNKNTFNEFVQILRDQNKKVFDAEEAKAQEFNKAMMDECDIKFKKINPSDLPDNITPKMYSYLSFMIK